MNLLTELTTLQPAMQAWRRHLHQFPELAYQEQHTADFIAEQLHSFGLTVDRGLATTGVVGTLTAGNSANSIALRADMDALAITEQNTFAHASKHGGVMHACGHDGHSAMLLGAACYLAEHKDFNGTVYFIFQPAEEGRAGAQQMIAEGLFNKFPADKVFGLHNFPGFSAGHFAVKTGAMMAAFDCFEIELSGNATHAAMPHLGHDVIVASAQLITSLQTVVSRYLNPIAPAVLSITQIHAGHTWNALPDKAVLRGTLRCFDQTIQIELIKRLQELVAAVASMFELSATVRINPENPGYPVTVNDEAATALAIKAATAVVGSASIHQDIQPSMGSEDFAFMLQEKPGCYLWLGNDQPGHSSCLHNPTYDFNDDILVVGAAYWVQLVREALTA
ncbi:M20 aminoacylase family protein [Methylocucumis oryzae]|uniref:Peptidase M20 n=1 Tax=Methylocucumis oryzae TaxID=1632867 RepID=A0A0F3IH13_9GAMM|nr:M20 aminoacylase family protein [Methylocucumis oryzae]KJV05997.1 peptidase M20 [Methylocucumis oryzae]